MAIHLVWCAIGRCRVPRILQLVLAVFLQLLYTTSGRSLVLVRDLSTRLVADGRKLNGSTRLLLMVARS